MHSFNSTGPFKTLESLPFDNTALRTLPIDPIKENYVRRSVKGACFSLVNPTPIENPRYLLFKKHLNFIVRI
jgi:hypothetical protein